MMTKRFLLSLILVPVALQCAAPEEAATQKKAIATKAGVIDFQKIIDMEEPANSASLEWRDIVADLEKKLKPRMEKIQNMQAKLQKEAKEARESGTADDDVAARLTKLKNEIDVDAQAYQSYSQKLLGEAQAQFGEKVQKSAKEIAKEQGWTHILPGPMIHVEDSSDITEDVVSRLNKNYRDEMRKKKFASAQKNS